MAKENNIEELGPLAALSSKIGVDTLIAGKWEISRNSKNKHKSIKPNQSKYG
jgi:hypothetical protein